MFEGVYDKFLMVSPCGSHAYDLSTDASDVDYAVMVLPSDFPDVPEDRPIKLNPMIGETEVDYFAHRLDSTRNIAYLAGIMYSYPKPPIGGSCEPLVDFWTSHHDEMLDIAPYLTYDSVMRDARHYIEAAMTREYGIAVRHMGLMMCRYETGSMAEAVKLNDLWRDRYFATKRGDVDPTELDAWYQEVASDRVKGYFDAQTLNYDLFVEWKRLVNTITQQ